MSRISNALSLAAVALSLSSAILSAAISCEPKYDPSGTVDSRLPNGVGGVDLKIRRHNDRNRVEKHSYSTPQTQCKVGANWPDCVRDESGR